MQARLECTIGNPEYARRIRHVLVKEVEQNHSLPISAGKGAHHPSDQRFPLPSLEVLERIVRNDWTIILLQRQFLHRLRCALRT